MSKEKIKITEYQIESSKLTASLRIIFLADLHCASHGEGNREVISECRRLCPDLILCGGDMVTARLHSAAGVTFSFLNALKEIAPLFGVNGNHETRLREDVSWYYSYIAREYAANGLHMLNNSSEAEKIRNQQLTITGLELSLEKYRKFRIPKLTAEEIKESIGRAKGAEYRILLAHNPLFIPRYLEWGADLVLSGHYHGGAARLTLAGRERCLLSPYGFPFPKYGYGLYRKGEQAAVVTAGLGEHTIPLRVNNPFEIVMIRLYPEGEKGGT